MIIYAPIIGDTIPAFTSEKIVVPFEHNPAVGGYNGMYLRVIQFADNQEIGTVTLSSSAITSPAVFTISNVLSLVPNSYYKVQMAYYDGNTAAKDAYYSSVAIGKCVNGIPKIEIEGLSLTNVNYNPKIYVGKYTAAVDEPAYWYRFTFYDNVNNVIQDSGLMLATDPSTMIYELRNDLQYGIEYSVKFQVITINNLESVVTYKIVKTGELPIDLNAQVVTTPHNDEGYIAIGLVRDPSDTSQGYFRLYRSTDCQTWDVLVDQIVIASTDDLSENRFTWRDYAVLQGQTYYYGLAQIGPSTSSIKLISHPTMVDYEDMYLTDGEKQLKIRLNPKVSSFKETLAEAKIDTIGSKYPFFSKNAAVGYKEFSISGLISYWMDNNQNFMTDDQLGFSNFSQGRANTAAENTTGMNVRTLDLVDYNFAAERTFKLAVLDWLNNGKPKFFRSPAEGNYVVRLMNVSLSPNDTLGRMLHTFSCQAYECDAADYLTLRNKQLIPDPRAAQGAKTITKLYSYYMSSGTSDFVLTGPADNVVLETLTPTNNTEFILNGTSYKMYFTKYSIGSLGPGQTFKVPYQVGNEQITIRYSIEENVESDIGANTFGQNVKNRYETFNDQSGIITPTPGFTYIYSLTASNTSGSSATIQIGDNAHAPTITIKSGETKFFNHINASGIQITITGKLNITINGY